jgi:processive 1,2-diacylglycerol beta-glucosyltransferase
MDAQNQAYPIRVGLFYGDKPSGHHSAAQAIADFFPSSIIEPVFVNLAELFPNSGFFLTRTYLGILNKTPGLWNYLYDNDFVAQATKKLQAAAFPYYCKTLSDTIQKRNLKAVVSTHAFAAMLLARRMDTAAQRRAGKAVPLFAVLTDFYAHSYWPAKGADMYFCPGQSAEAGLKGNGVAPGAVLTTGIPVRKEFMILEDARQKRKELGLAPDIFTVLISGGSKGLGDIPLAAEVLKKFLGRLQLVIMCGGNQKLYATLEKNLAGARHCRLVRGFVNNPADYLKAADLVVGKAGGVTIAETMALHKPMLLFSSFPGQEERNTRFLVKNRLAELAEDPRHLERLIRRYLLRPGSLAAIKNRIISAARPCAARDIAAKIMERLLPVKRDTAQP